LERPDYYAAHPLLRELVDDALERNPSVREAHSRYLATHENVPVVTALPDPMLTVGTFVRRVETRVGPQRASVMLSQRFPWRGKRGLRGEIVELEAAARYEIFHARQREIVAAVKTAFYELGYVDSALRIAAEETALLDHFERLATARYASGEGLQAAVVRLQAESTRIRSRVELLRQQRGTLRARINALLDRDPGAEIPAIDGLAPPESELDAEELLRLGTEHREELRAAEKFLERGERRVELAQRDRWPDLTLGVGYVDVGTRSDPAGLQMPPPDNGKNAFSVSLGLNLPLSGAKYEAGVRMAREELSTERYRYQDLLNQLELAITEEILRLENLRSQRDLFQRVLLPQAEEALRSIEAAYESGRVGVSVTDLLDGERVRLEVRLASTRFHSDELSSLAQIERAIGARFPR
jgi:outer membrane protein TolC